MPEQPDTLPLTDYDMLKTRSSSSADGIANVNFFDDDIVHVLQNTTDSRINFAAM